MTRWPLVCLLAVGAACATDPQGKSLERARAQWLEHGGDYYQVTVQRICFCPSIDPVRIRVHNGQVIDRTVVPTGQPLDPRLADAYPAIPGLFDLVEDAYRRADKVNVTFNELFGYPENVTIDYVAAGIDDELTLRVTDLQLMPPPG